jgi:hypothetical protein
MADTLGLSPTPKRTRLLARAVVGHDLRLLLKHGGALFRPVGDRLCRELLQFELAISAGDSG